MVTAGQATHFSQFSPLSFSLARTTYVGSAGLTQADGRARRLRAQQRLRLDASFPFPGYSGT